MVSLGFERSAEAGTGGVVAVAAIGFLFLVVAQFTQFAAFQYGRGAVRSAAMAGARAASPENGTAAACEAEFNRVRDELLGGPIGDGVGDPVCVIDAGTVRVTSHVDFEGWLPGAPGWSFDVDAVAVKERVPQ